MTKRGEWTKCRVCENVFKVVKNGQNTCSQKCRERLKKKKKEEHIKSVNKNLVDISIEAKERGMSYGQYVAMMQKGEKKHAEVGM